MFEQDYVMRLIHEVVRALLKLLFNIDTEKKDDIIFNEKAMKDQYDILLDLIDSGKINDAENKLYSDLDSSDPQYYILALMFYSYLNEKDIDFLEEHDFSKKEIIEGLKDVSTIYGHGSIAGTMLNILTE